MKVLFVCILASLTSSVLCHDYGDDTFITREEEKVWESIASRHEQVLLPQKNRYLYLIKNITQKEYSLSKECRSSRELLSQKVQEQEENAVRILDSCTHSWPGLAYDQVIHYGHYYQCMEAVFDGKYARYALIQVDFPISDIFAEDRLNSSWTSAVRRSAGHVYPMFHAFAVCLPSQCSDGDIERVLQSAIISEELSLKLHSSQSYEEDSYASVRMVSTVAARIWLLVIVINIYASFWQSNNRIVQSFNMFTNHGKIMAPPRPLEDDRYAYFTLFRFGFFATSSFGHTILGFSPGGASLYSPAWKFLRLLGCPRFSTITFLRLNNSTFHSACLMGLSASKVIGKVPLFLIVIHHLAKTVPVIFFTVLIQMAIPAISPPGIGPLFPSIFINLTQRCLKKGWMDVAMMDNLVPANEDCLPVTWFVSLATQMLFWSLPMLYLFGRGNFVPGVIVGMIQMIIGMKMHANHLLTENKPYGIMITEADTNTSWRFFAQYVHPVGYLAAWPVGVIIGYLLLTDNKKGKSVSRIDYAIGHISHSAMHVVLLITFFVYDWNGHPTISDGVGLVWAVLQRPLFILFSGLFTYTILMPSKIVQEIGKSYVVNVLHRITFSAFMFHNVFINFIQANRSSAVERGLIQFLGLGIYVLVMSLVAGYFITLLIEIPFGNLFTILIGDKKERLQMKQSEKKE